MRAPPPFRAVLLDLDGTIYEDDRPVAGATQAVAAVRAAGIQVRFVSNTTRRSRAGLVARLRAMGFELAEEELFTAVSAAAAWCRSNGTLDVLPLLSAEALADLQGLHIVASRESEVGPRSTADPARCALGADPAASAAVVVGDLGGEWSFEALNLAFRFLQAGATLVACQKNRYWKTGGRLSLDAGPFVAALEYATGREAVVVGKPSPIFFRSALEAGAVAPRDAVMVGDDAEVDAGGAIAAGLSGWLVRTGKYRPGDESRASPWPECVLGSVAELPEALGL